MVVAGNLVMNEEVAGLHDTSATCPTIKKALGGDMEAWDMATGKAMEV